MSTTSSELPVILYHYPYSPFARRVSWYLELRGIPFVQCIQPPILPRPDIARLGIRHRRIPILSVGRDVYLDSRLILQKLEQLHPDRPRLGTSANSQPEQRAVERLLEVLSVDGGVFTWASQLLPTSLPLLRDPAFQKDRVDYTGLRLSADDAAALRPEALVEIHNVMELLETTLLADGRDWILKTETPSLADIEAVWPLHWLARLPGAFPPEYVSASRFPKVFAWIERFHKATGSARAARAKPATVSGEEAQIAILNSPYSEAEMSVDDNDPVVRFYGLTKGQQVILWPIDTGVAHKDTGKLVGISSKEVVIETDGGSGPVRVHAPRHGFKVRDATKSGSNL